VIASPNAGASRDLIRNGENGYISDFSDHQKTATLISNLLDDPQQCRKTGERAAAFIREKGGIRQSAEGFTSAILKANR
jgi:glycosyltransferase involved in cell wall biosynthesis